MSERVVLVTGATDGIGRATARALAAAGLNVMVHGRSQPKVDAALGELRAELPGAKLDGVSFDLGQPAQIRNAVGELLARTPVLHALVNNAGIFASEHVATGEGVELTFAVNCLGPFLLTELVMPRLLRSATAAPSRVIDVASMAASRGKLDFGDLQMTHRWTAYGAYANSPKLANVMHAIVARGEARRDQARRVQPAPRRDRHQAAAPGLRSGPGRHARAGRAHERAARRRARCADGEPSGSVLRRWRARPRRRSPRAIREAARALWDAMTKLAVGSRSCSARSRATADG